MSAESARVLEILDELRELFVKKNIDYGLPDDPMANLRSAPEWGMPAWIGCMLRANDKLKRLQRVARGGTLANESIEDSFRDIALYAIEGWVLWEETQRPEMAAMARELAKKAQLERESQGRWHD